MKRIVVLLMIVLMTAGCAQPRSPTVVVRGADEPYPATWTPTTQVEDTATATRVVQPTPTWDGTPPPPSKAEVPRVKPGQLYRALEAGEEVTVVDVRVFAAYNQAHVPGALHIPLDELGERVGELAGSERIVVYCLSTSDAMGLEAAMLLYRAGLTGIEVLEGGIQAWYSQGYPIEGSLLTPTPRPTGPPWTVTPLTPETPTGDEPETPTVEEGTPRATEVAPTRTPTVAANTPTVEAATGTPTATRTN